MGETTGIAWCHHTLNSWWGCSRVSPGCERCYAEALAKRVGHGTTKMPLWGVDAARKPASEKQWSELAKWDRKAGDAGVRRRVFVASMADVFEEAPARNSAANDVMAAGRERLWKAIFDCQNLDFLLLTKRPENVQRLAPWAAEWPSNVWLGTTVEDQQRANERIPHLLATPARVRFLSCEPLLEPVQFTVPANFPDALGSGWDYVNALTGRGSVMSGGDSGGPVFPRVDWVIVGGESGGSLARPFNVAWARVIVRECSRAKVACFVKQLGSNPVTTPSLLGLAISPLWLRSRSGDDPSEWPEGLRVQQFPEVRP